MEINLLSLEWDAIPLGEREELFHLLRAMRSLAHTLFLSAQTCMHPESFINFNWKRSSAFGSPVLFIIAVPKH